MHLFMSSWDHLYIFVKEISTQKLGLFLIGLFLCNYIVVLYMLWVSILYHVQLTSVSFHCVDFVHFHL